jgi:hypothetical protein
MLSRTSNGGNTNIIAIMTAVIFSILFCRSFIHITPHSSHLTNRTHYPEEEKYVRGKTKSAGCSMTKSLSIPRTNAFVWHYVKEVIKDSSLLKELFKTVNFLRLYHLRCLFLHHLWLHY